MDAQAIQVLREIAQPTWTDVVGAVAAIGTLIVSIVGFFVLIQQLNQFNQNMRFDAYSSHIEDQARINQLLIDHPQLNQHFYAGRPDVLALTDSEKDFYNTLGFSLGLLARMHSLYRKGWIDGATWSAWERWFAEHWFSLPVFLKFWDNESRFYEREFVEEIEKRLRSRT